MSVGTLNKEAQEDGEDAFPGKGNQTPEKARITELEREVRWLKQEREIFKRAKSHFADKERV